MEKDEYQNLLEKYKERVKEEFGEESVKPSKITSKEYTEFKSELYPTHYSIYEKACNFSDKVFKLTVDEKKSTAIQKNLDVCHLNVKPSGVIALSFLLPIIIIVLGSLIFFTIFQMMFFVAFT